MKKIDYFYKFIENFERIGILRYKEIQTDKYIRELFKWNSIKFMLNIYEDRHGKIQEYLTVEGINFKRDCSEAVSYEWEFRTNEHNVVCLYGERWYSDGVVETVWIPLK